MFVEGLLEADAMVMCRHQYLLSSDGCIESHSHWLLPGFVGLILPPRRSRDISPKQLDYFTVGALCD